MVTIEQLHAVGLSHRAVSGRTRTGRLHRVHPGVYAVGHAALSREARWSAAVLAAGPSAALGRLAAAALYQVWRRRVAEISVVAPRVRKVGSGVKVHECRNLDSRDVTVVRFIPVTTVPRMLVDLTDELSAQQLANVIHEAAFRGLFDGAATRAAMERANGRRNLKVLTAALAAHAHGSAGTKSEGEDRFLALMRAAGLPEPVSNVVVTVEARPIEIDFLWPELRLCVEVDGSGHGRPRTRADDAIRDDLLRVAGHEVLRFPRPMVYSQAGEVVGAVAAAIRRLRRARGGPRGPRPAGGSRRPAS